MAAMGRCFIYIYIKGYHQNNVGFCVSECISTQGNVLYAKGKDGKHRHSKTASTYRDNKEVFALAHIKQSLYIYPVHPASFSLNTALAVSLNTSSCWGII